MEQVKLRAETGRETGSRPARRLRRTGKVPAIVYGHGLDALNVAVDQRELYGVLHTEAGSNALITLEVDDGSEYLTIAREIQRHPVRGEITHLDFIQISLDEKIQAEVGIEFLGVPLGVREEGGILETVNGSVMIEALPMAVPSSIELDISELTVGDSLKASDLPELDGVDLVSDPEMTLVTVVIPRIVEEEVVEEEPEYDEEGNLIVRDEAEGEEGEGEDGEEGGEESSGDEDEG